MYENHISQSIKRTVANKDHLETKEAANQLITKQHNAGLCCRRKHSFLFANCSIRCEELYIRDKDVSV